MDSKRVAIIGGGCSGLGALWALRRTRHEVQIFEKEDYLGGHVYTLPFKAGGVTCNVDTGFIVCNPVTYPNFMPFLDELDVEITGCDMSFGVSRDGGKFEWAGISPATVFTQVGNLFSPRHWRMVFDIIRFNQFSIDILNDDNESEEVPTKTSTTRQIAAQNKLRRQETIDEYLNREGYSSGFRNDYLIPMTAAIWGTGSEKTTLDFPAITLVRFMWNHQLLNTVSHRAQWYSIKGGSKLYVDAMMRIIEREGRGKVHLSSPVHSVSTNSEGKQVLRFPDGREEVFDHVIIATHGDQALRLLKTPTVDEEDILSNFKTVPNVAYLHSDLALMPKRTAAWAAWNYMTATIGHLTGPESLPHPAKVEANGKPLQSMNGAANGAPKQSTVAKQGSRKGDSIDTVCLTFDMNLLQHIPRSIFGNVLVTLNPIVEPAREKVQAIINYRHPLFNPAMIAAQARLPEIQNQHGISFCGAWTKYGFHEDGFASGLHAAIEHLGGSVEWNFQDATFIRGRPTIDRRKRIVRAVIQIIQFFLNLLAVVVGLLTGDFGVLFPRRR